MMKSIIASAGLIAVASAFTQPTTQTYGSLLTPDLNTPVTTGQDYTITWSPKQPADGVTVSLVLCNGPGSNCVLQSTAIVEGVPAASGSYKWSVPCSLPEGVQSTATGYGMLIIVDGTGEFQYSTQFSVLKGSSCSASSSSSSTSTTSTTSKSSSSSVSTTSASSSQASSGMPSGRPSSSTDVTGGWYGWTSTLNTTTVYPTATSSIYTSGAVMTSKPVGTSTSTYVKPSSSAAASATSATPAAYTGAASQQLISFGLIGAGLLLAL